MQILKVKFGKRAQAEAISGFVYCGRAFGGFNDSPLGNPYKPGRDGTLPEILDRFHTYLDTQAQCDSAERAALTALTADSVLGCWCVNKENAGERPWCCHCDVIACVWASHFGGKNYGGTGPIAMRVELSDEELALIREGLNMKANIVETGNPLLSAQDAAARKLTPRALNTEQMELVLKIRKLTERLWA